MYNILFAGRVITVPVRRKLASYIDVYSKVRSRTEGREEQVVDDDNTARMCDVSCPVGNSRETK